MNAIFFELATIVFLVLILSLIFLALKKAFGWRLKTRISRAAFTAIAGAVVVTVGAMFLERLLGLWNPAPIIYEFFLRLTNALCLIGYCFSAFLALFSMNNTMEG